MLHGAPVSYVKQEGTTREQLPTLSKLQGKCLSHSKDVFMFRGSLATTVMATVMFATTLTTNKV